MQIALYQQHVIWNSLDDILKSLRCVLLIKRIREVNRRAKRRENFAGDTRMKVLREVGWRTGVGVKAYTWWVGFQCIVLVPASIIPRLISG
jgi:hypothetical protein